AEVELEWLRRFVAKAQAEVAKRRAAEPTPHALQEIRKVIIELKKNAPKIDFTVDDILDVLDRYHFSLIRHWRGPPVDGVRLRLRQTIAPLCAELGIGEVSREELEARIPADTLQEIQNPRSKKLWNVMMVLKDKGFTINSSIALIKKYPTAMAAKYRGRLQNEVEKIWAKLNEGKNPKPKAKKKKHSPVGSTKHPPAAPEGPQIPTDETIKVFQRWLLLKDDTPIYAVLGAIAANYLEGDPVWFGVIGPPSSAKTEILNA